MPCRPDATPLAAHAAGFAPPVVVFCKSHSGSRLLAAALQRLGVFLGEVLNESLDALPMLPVVEHVVERHHPDFTRWHRDGSDAETGPLLERALDAHFGGRPRSTKPWGWKLCETVYAVPVIEAAFPGARYIHLIRDGRDVAFCDHAVPDTPFWKKVSFGTDRITAWRGRRLGYKDYHRQSHIFNAAHWCASVGLGRTYGALLGPRYLEVRYEDLCHRFPESMARIAAFIGIEPCAEALTTIAARVSTGSIGKHRERPTRILRQVLEIESPLLLSLGYLDTDPLAKPPRSLRRRVSGWWHGSERRRAA
ncbi:MAG: sulfotransferase [Planctomycetota bacterium]